MKTLLNIKQLSIGYGNPLIDGININVEEKKLIAIIGRNGSGKSTLLKTVAGLLPALSGDVTLYEEKLNSLNSAERAKKLSFVSTREKLVQHISVAEYVKFGRYPYTNWIGAGSNTDTEMVDHAIKSCDLSEISHLNYYELSDGQRQRVNIARAITQDTPLILLDEPTAHLDLIQRLEVLKLLRQLTTANDKLVLFATHHVEYALQLADEIWLVDNEVTTYTPKEIVQNEQFLSLFSNNSIAFDKSNGSFKLNLE